MKRVTQYPIFIELHVPEYYYDIHLTTWEEVAMIFVRQVAATLHPEADDAVGQLTDEEIQQLYIPNVSNLTELKQYARGLFQQSQMNTRFYQHILPFIGAMLAITAEVVVDAADQEAFIANAMDRVQEQAAAQEMSVADYTAQLMNQADNPEQALREAMEEEYIFRLVAEQWYADQGYGLSELDYEAYIQQAVQKGDDEIELRERFPYHVFELDMPAMAYTDALFQFVKPKFRFIVDGAAN